MRKYATFALLFGLAFSLLFLDFYTKAYVHTFLPIRGDLPVFHDFLGIDFSITLAYNRGMAWGALPQLQTLILVLRILVIMGILIYLFFFNRERWREIPLLLIVTGAFGNVVDTFLYGSVVDFLRFNLWGYPFPIFNLADTLITCGVASYFLLSLFSKKANQNVTL